jgi:flagellar FliL protein
MADEGEDTELEEEAPPKRGNGLLLVIMVVNTLALIGGGVYFALFHQPAAAATPADAEPEPDPHAVGPMIQLDSIVANLAEETSSRFVKLTMHLELKDAEDQPVVEAALVPIKSAILLHLSSLTVDDTVGTEKKEKIRETLLEKINETIGAEKVRRLFFTEFVVQ